MRLPGRRSPKLMTGPAGAARGRCEIAIRRI